MLVEVKCGCHVVLDQYSAADEQLQAQRLRVVAPRTAVDQVRHPSGALIVWEGWGSGRHKNGARSLIGPGGMGPSKKGKQKYAEEEEVYLIDQRLVLYFDILPLWHHMSSCPS